MNYFNNEHKPRMCVFVCALLLLLVAIVQPKNYSYAFSILFNGVPYLCINNFHCWFILFFQIVVFVIGSIWFGFASHFNRWLLTVCWWCGFMIYSASIVYIYPIYRSVCAFYCKHILYIYFPFFHRYFVCVCVCLRMNMFFQ